MFSQMVIILNRCIDIYIPSQIARSQLSSVVIVNITTISKVIAAAGRIVRNIVWVVGGAGVCVDV